MSRVRLGYRGVTAVVLGWLCVSGSAIAQPTPPRTTVPTTQAEQSEARERYARAIQMVNEGRYDAALTEMQRAYSLNPSYKILYNLAQIHVHLGDAAAAVGNFERYLSEGGAEIPAPRSTEVNQEIAKLRPRVGSVEIVVKEGGAEVLVDDAVVGRSPCRKTVLVNAGRHRFSAARTGTPPVTRIVAVAGMDTLVLELDLGTSAQTAAKSEPNTGSAVASDRGTASEAGAQKGRSGVWIGWAATGALAAGTVVSAFLTKASADALDDRRNTPGASRQELDDQSASTRRNAIITDVLLGATVVAGAVSFYYTIAPRSSSEPSTRPSTEVRVGAIPGGLFVGGSF